ncbi:hypothetical protein OUZ56_033295 [Daphnia magna]|uniref:Uncharacterized protein n=1 Tax=Daphnia magna TaxID=35525 RepID=A0ABR0BAK1_9CRUS|nr:hypothetical protein OUZ56_033295 [Daphnia magna]
MYDLQETPLLSMWYKHSLWYAISTTAILFLQPLGNITTRSFVNAEENNITKGVGIRRCLRPMLRTS